MAGRDLYDQIDPYLSGELEDFMRAHFEAALSRDEALRQAVDHRRKEQLAMDKLEVFLEDEKDLSHSRKTWLRSLFATVMLMSNFSLGLKDKEDPTGWSHSDEPDESIPGSN